MTTIISPEELTLQQNALATSMLYEIGNAATNFVIDPQGVRVHQSPSLNLEELGALIDEFSKDPKEVIAGAREALFKIYSDERLDGPQSRRRLSRYIDAYTDLCIILDHTVFPPSEAGDLNRGVPSYIPDGFVDMGGNGSEDPSVRNREQIVVDKKAILDRYKPLLMSIFETDYSEVGLQDKKKHMVEKIAYEVYRKVPYDNNLNNGERNLGGGEIRLSELSEGVCRHQALVFQVLCQAIGVKSQILKSCLNGGRHSTNAVRIDDEWYIVDATAPDYETRDDGKKLWRLGAFKTGIYPGVRGTSHNVRTNYSGQDRNYTVHNDMYWRIVEV